MNANAIWQRKYEILWAGLAKNTQDSYCTPLWKWLVGIFVARPAKIVQTTQVVRRKTLAVVLTKMSMLQDWCDEKGLDVCIHPITKCLVFMEVSFAMGPQCCALCDMAVKPLHQYWLVSQDLLEEMIQKKSKDPFGTIRVARKALSRIRYECLQRRCGKLCVEQAVHA